MRVDLQPAYVIHGRPYSDSSALLEVFTAEYGRIGLIARGARRREKKSGAAIAAILQPFTPLLLSFRGRSELKTLAAMEPAKSVPRLRGTRLFSAMYLNELLVRLLHRNDAHPALFAAYDKALDALAREGAIDTVLRHFEYTLLDELGYRLELARDAASGIPVQALGRYRYVRGQGLVAINGGDGAGATTYSGAELLAMASGDFDGPARGAAKRLLREALAEHLGDRPLRSRELFRSAASLAARGGQPVRPDTGIGDGA